MKDIALHILDIARNSVVAGAELIVIETKECRGSDRFTLTLTDNGCGMDSETVQKLTDPWFTSRTTRRVGMGIPLLMQSAVQAGGGIDISSEPGNGTRVTAVFSLSHIDLPPKGDIAGVISMLAGANPEIDFVYRHKCGEAEYIFDTREVKEVLENVPLSEPKVIGYMKEMIGENLGELEEHFIKYNKNH